MRARARDGIEERADPQIGIGDPALAEYLGIGATSAAGVSISESSALQLSAVWRSVNLIAGTIAGLPLKTYKRTGDNGQTKERVNSFLDQPHPDMTQFEWTETVMAQALLWGNDYLLHVTGGAGQIVGLWPLSPAIVTIRIDENIGKVFKVKLRNGDVREFTSLDLTHVPGLNSDGIKGMSPISVARESLGTAVASDKAAARMFKNGLLLGGMLSAKETLTKTQAAKVLSGLQRKSGSENAGDVAFIPASVDFKPWTMNAIDAQFLESRHFGIMEIARWFGVPRELLSESGASSWGSGIQELVRAFARFTLAGWTTRLEQRLSLLLPKNQFCEFDYSGLLQPSPEVEIALLIQQVDAGILTTNEARAIRNLAPLAQPAPTFDRSVYASVNRREEKRVAREAKNK
ncbi:MAG: phage portal protein [Actinomycetota bacterium]